MEPNIKNIFKSAKRVALTPAERVRIGVPQLPVRSPYAFLHSQVLKQFVAVLLIVVLAGSGTAYAASDALPGDILFPVKINVNERVETLLATTPKAQAQVAADQALRRLGEAEELAHQGRLSRQATKVVEDNFSEKAAEVKLHVQKLRDSHDGDSADKIEKNFDDSVDTHFQSFVDLNSSEGSTTEGVGDVKQTLERHRGTRGHGDGGDSEVQKAEASHSGKEDSSESD